MGSYQVLIQYTHYHMLILDISNVYLLTTNYFTLGSSYRSCGQPHIHWSSPAAVQLPSADGPSTPGDRPLFEAL